MIGMIAGGRTALPDLSLGTGSGGKQLNFVISDFSESGGSGALGRATSMRTHC